MTDPHIATSAARAHAVELLLAHVAQAYAPAVFASSFGAEDMVLLDLIARGPPADPRLHARHRPAAAGDARPDRPLARPLWHRHRGLLAADATPSQSFVREHGINAFYDSVALRTAMLQHPQERAAESRARRQGRLDHRPAPRARRSRARRSRSRSSTRRTACPSSIRSPTGARTTSGTTCARVGVPYNALHDHGYPSIGCAPCTRAVAAGRGRARRTLVVGARRSARNAAAPAPAESQRATRARWSHERARARIDARPAPPDAATRPARRCPTTSTGSSPKRSTSCAKSPASARTRRCSSPAARIRSCCCGSPRRRSVPGRFPFPLLHIDTGHNFPEVIAFRDARAAELGERLIVRSVEDSIAQRPRAS